MAFKIYLTKVYNLVMAYIFILIFCCSLNSKDIYTGHILSIPPSPYPASVSQALTSMVNLDSVLFNPAGMGLLTYSGASFAHNRYIEDISQNYLNILINTQYGNICVFYSEMKTDDIISYDFEENIIGNTSASYSYYGISYSKGFPYFDYARKKIDPMLISPSWSKIKPVKVYIPKVYRFSFGITGKKVIEKLDTEKSGSSLFDAGVLAVLPGHFHIGGSIQNISFKKIKFYQQNEKIPVTVRFGIAKDFSTIKNIMNFTFMLDRVSVEGKEAYFNFGTDIDISKAFQIRIGYTSDKSSMFSDFSLGVGMTFDNFLTKESLIKGLRMDYAYLKHKIFDVTHRIGFQLIW